MASDGIGMFSGGASKVRHQRAPKDSGGEIFAAFWRVLVQPQFRHRRGYQVEAVTFRGIRSGAKCCCLFGNENDPAPAFRRRAETFSRRQLEGVSVNPFLFRAACKLGLEGWVSKRRDRPYQAGRSKYWVKVKHRAHPAMDRGGMFQDVASA